MASCSVGSRMSQRLPRSEFPSPLRSADSARYQIRRRLRTRERIESLTVPIGPRRGRPTVSDAGWLAIVDGGYHRSPLYCERYVHPHV